jgi:hypothetical protein
MGKKFSENYQPEKRKGRGKSERTKFLEALQRSSFTEEDFYDHLISEAMVDKSPIALSEILKRVSPIPKATAPTIEFELDSKLKPHQKASATLDAIASGRIPPDIGSMLITSIKAFVDIEEHDDLKDRIEKLESMIG